MRYHSRPLAVSIALAVAAGAAVADEQVALASPGVGAGGSPDLLAGWKVPSISWRTSRGSEAPGPEVVINDMVVVRPLAAAGGIPPEERARIIAARISSLVYSDAKEGRTLGGGVCAVFRDGEWVVAGGADGRPLVATADASTAGLHSMSARDLAEIWSNNIRLALGLPLYERRWQEPPSRAGGRSTWPVASPGATGGSSGQPARSSDGGPVATWWGVASWYGPGFHGHRTANGEVYDQYALTAAHRTLPFGTLVRVSFPATGRAAVVRINDRGPWIKGRSLDLSLGAARVLGMVNHGLAKVRVEVLRLGS